MSRSIAYTVVDAFTSVPFQGNPAAVIVLDAKPSHELSDALLQKIAAEFNLSETVYATPIAPSTAVFNLRWFTPTIEAPLCGHATLATAYALFNNALITLPPDTVELTFHTRSGQLKARKFVSNSEVEEGVIIEQIELEFPAAPTEEVGEAMATQITNVLQRALGDERLKIANIRLGTGGQYTGYLLIEVDESFDLENAKLVDISALQELDRTTCYAVIVTSSRPAIQNPQASFISRFFAPHMGIAEDPVCGSSHCVQAPYWSEKLGVPEGQVLHARQVSSRGGNVDVVYDRVNGVVKLRGEAVVVTKGELYF